MKIRINVNEEDSKFRISLWVPTGLIRSRFVWRQIGKLKGMTPELAQKLQRSFDAAYRQMKEYIRTNGHFTMVEAVSDGSHVRIIV